ncbi:putative protein YjdJ [compost metagenome]
MEIIQRNEDRKGIFIALEEGQEAGNMSYTWAGTTKFIIDHTEVDPAFKGKGVGKQLVMKAVEYAREHQVKILPLCPFAKAMFDRNADLHDILF